MSKVGYVYDGATSSWVSFSGPPADATPTGIVAPYAGSTAPNAWLLCNGQEVSRTTYAALFAIIGTTYGAGNATTTFNVPDLRGRVVTGVDSSQTEFDTLGKTGGSKTNTLLEANLPSHTHTTPALSGTFTSSGVSAWHTHSGTTSTNTHSHSTNTSGDASSFLSGSTVNMRYTDTASPSLNTSNDSHNHTMTTGNPSSDHTHNTTVSFGAGTTGATGSGTAVNNLQPYQVFNYIIKT